MSENKLPDSHAPKESEVHFDTSTPPGTRMMNLVLGVPLLLVMIGVMVYGAIAERQPMYLLVVVAVLVVIVFMAWMLRSAPTNKSTQINDHQ